MGRLMIAALFSTLGDRRLRKTNNTNAAIRNKAITVTVDAITAVELVGVAWL